MDNLKEIIFSLSESQQKDFVFFIQRNKYRKDRKDLKLFELLQSKKELNPQQFVKQLKCTNLNAYYTIRKRLFKHLSDFIVLQASTTDASQASHIGTLLSVVRYLFDKGLNQHAWKYIEIAEQLALKNNYFDALHSIYLLQMDKAFLNPTLNFDALYKKYQENSLLLHQSEKVQIACALLRQELQKAVQEQKVLKFSKTLKKVLHNLGVDREILYKPRIALTFVQTLRELALSSKSFVTLEKFITVTLKKLYKNNSKILPEVDSQLQFYLAHAQFRNRQFQEAFRTLKKAKKLFQQCPPVFRKNFEIKVAQLDAALLLFTNRIDNAISALSNIVYECKTTALEHNNSLVNLGAYYFINNQPKAALQCLNEFSHSDNYYQKSMGVEWVLKKQLMEILLFSELGHIDIVDSRIKAFIRKYKGFDHHPIYSRAFGFLKIIDQMMKNKPEEKLQNSIDQNIVFLDNAEEDLQAMTYYAWVKSKVEKKRFYKVLLELTSKD